jgi:RHS repeat-associated protein
VSYTFDTAGRPNTVTGAENSTTSNYTAAGNQTAITGSSRAFTYDAENRQSTASIGGTDGVVTTYTYDGDGRRVQKAVSGGATTTYVYDAQGNLTAEYGASTPNSPGTSYLTGDHLGSTRLVTNSSGSAFERYDYAPFGEELTQGIDGRTGPYSTNSYPTATQDAVTEKFTSKERDSETGLDFFKARYMSSAQGRFSSPDRVFADQHTANPQSWNLYVYARNNPLKLVDLNGFKVLEAVVAQAVQKMTAISNSGGGRFYLDFDGIQGLHAHGSLGPHSNFDKWHSDHSDETSQIVPNNGIFSGFLRALFGIANKDQVDTANAIVGAVPGGVSLSFDTYSNGINAAGKVAAGMAPGSLDSALVVAPNTGWPSGVQAIDQADNFTTQIYVSANDPALAVSLFGAMAPATWTEFFGSRVRVTDQASHNLDRYQDAVGAQDAARQCALGNRAACP